MGMEMGQGTRFSALAMGTNLILTVQLFMHTLLTNAHVLSRLLKVAGAVALLPRLLEVAVSVALLPRLLKVAAWEAPSCEGSAPRSPTNMHYYYYVTAPSCEGSASLILLQLNNP